MRNWLEKYERARHGEPEEKESWTKEMWISSKYDFQNMPWQDLQNLWLPGVKMRFGPACHKLKALWRDYRKARFLGLSGAASAANEINQIQRSMGVEVSQFDELAAIGEYEEETPGSDAE